MRHIIIIVLAAALALSSAAPAQAQSEYWVTDWTYTTITKTIAGNDPAHAHVTTGTLSYTVPASNIIAGLVTEITAYSGTLQFNYPHLSFDAQIGQAGKNPACLYNNTMSSEQVAICTAADAASMFRATMGNYSAGYVHNRTQAYNSGWSNTGSVTYRMRYIFYGAAPVNAVAQCSPLSGNAPLLVTFTDQSTGSPTSWNWNFGDGSTQSTQQNPTHTYSAAGDYTVTLTASKSGSSDTATCLISVMPPAALPGTLTRPLGPYDRVDWEDANEGMFDFALAISQGDEFLTPIADNIEKNVLQVVSKTANAPVLSVTEGTVVQVQDFNNSICNLSANATGISLMDALNNLVNSNTCYFFVPGAVAPGTIDLPYVYRLDYSDSSWVFVEAPTGEVIVYWVKDAAVSVGDVVAAGCIVGKTMGLLNTAAFELSGLTVGGATGGAAIAANVDFDSETGIGGSFIFAVDPDTEEIVRLLPLLTVDKQPLEACNVNPQFSTCSIRDPQLRDSTAWFSDGSVQWDATAGATLQPGAAISMQLPLDSGTEYGVTVQARKTGGADGWILIQLGTSDEMFRDVSTTANNFSLPPAIVQPDAGSLYTVRVSNVGSAPLVLGFVCVATDLDEGVGSCGFRDPSFDYGTAQWTYSGMVYLGSTPGNLWMGAGGSISQNIKLEPGTYPIVVDMMVPSIYWTSPGTFTLNWSYGTQSGTFGDLTDLTFSEFQIMAGGLPELRFTLPHVVQLEVATQTAATFTLSVTMSGAPADTLVEIQRVCIDFPFGEGIGDGSSSGLPPAPFFLECDRVNTPSETSVGAWTLYLWRNLNRFFQCDLMILLNDMHKTANQGVGLLRWALLYGQASTDVWTKWMGGQLFPWLNGHFANIARGNVMTINQEGYQCQDFWCLLQGIGEGLQTIAGFIDTILSLVRIVFSIGLWVINQLLGMAGIGINLLGTLLSAWNTATPATVPGLTNCDVNPPTGLCQGIWILDNTIFAEGGRGALFIPLLIGIFSVHLALWVISRIRSTIEQIGAMS
jgi:PKD repeat protein